MKCITEGRPGGSHDIPQTESARDHDQPDASVIEFPEKFCPAFRREIKINVVRLIWRDEEWWDMHESDRMTGRGSGEAGGGGRGGGSGIGESRARCHGGKRRADRRRFFLATW